MKKAREPTYSFVILTFVLILVSTLLAWLSVKLAPAAAGGVSLIYVAVAFMILFTLWFGAYGAIAAYGGTLLGAWLLASDSFKLHPEIALLWAAAGLLQVLIPLVALRSLDFDLNLVSRRDWTLLLLFGVLINNIAGAVWGAWTLSLIPAIPPVAFGSVFATWLIGNMIVTILIVPVSLKLLTPRIERSKLFVRNYWD